jgi:uncharacterized membrane protein YbhN (UPF0104 family)
LLLRWAVALALLGTLFALVPLPEIAAELDSVPPHLLGVAATMVLLVHLLVARRLKVLTDRHDVPLSTWRAFEIDLAARFYGLILPGGNISALTVRFLKLSWGTSSYAGALAAISLDRILATLVMCATGAGFWLLERPDGALPVLLAMLLSTALLLAVVLALATPTHLPLSRSLRRYAEQRAADRLGHLILALRKWGDLPRHTLFAALGLSLLVQLLGTLSYAVLAAAAGITIPFIALGWIRCAVMLATMLPISALGLGVREAAMFFLLAGYGVETDRAIAYSLLVFTVTVLGPTLLGGLLEARAIAGGWAANRPARR